MISFMSYNFCSDGNCVDPVPTNIQTLTTTRLYGGVYDHFNVTGNSTDPYDSTIPESWEDDTILNAKFEGTTNAADLSINVRNITAISIKRRRSGTYNWVPIREIKIESLDDLYFAFNDYLVTPGIYEYAFVPIMGDGVEGQYIVEELDVNFNGCFVCDVDAIYKLFVNVTMTGTTQQQAVATFEPFGRRFPVYVSNAATNYQKGQFSATVLNADYLETRQLDRAALRQNRDAFVDFLTNKKAKIIKDWNGNAWMVAISDNVSITFNTNTNNALADVAFSYVEIGEVDNEDDMRLNGLIPGGGFS